MSNDRAIITEKDFKRVGEAFDVHPRADSRYFELAAQMAIEFERWRRTYGVKSAKKTPEELFNIYQNQPENSNHEQRQPSALKWGRRIVA